MGSLTNLRIKDGDGEGEGSTFTTEILIKVVSNGYIVTSTDSDDGEAVEVYSFNNQEALLKAIREELAIEGSN